jgi:hypothetical protein
MRMGNDALQRIDQIIQGHPGTCAHKAYKLPLQVTQSIMNRMGPAATVLSLLTITPLADGLNTDTETRGQLLIAHLGFLYTLAHMRVGPRIAMIVLLHLFFALF